MKYKILIFDFEVFAHDWLVVFSDLDEKEITVIHNDNDALKKMMLQKNVLFGGYNVKHYDNWIAQSILAGCTPEQVKECNDWIINQGNNGWDFPLLEGARREFISFDLMDDLSVPISLKAIEANTKQSIVESKIDFTVTHKLSKAELDEVIYYCKNDVKATVSLYKLRKSYLDAKISVAAMKGWNEAIALPLTNPKLTAKFLGAVPTKHTDEFEYTPPASLKLDKYPEALEFYKTVDYQKNLDLEVCGLVQHFGWGGIHSAKEHYTDASDDEYKIVDIDVGSYYPSLAIKWNFISRNIPSKEGYEQIYHDRLEAKHTGNKVVADNYKLILNSTYGASKDRYNALYDAKMANAICISGQLYLVMLLSALEDIEGLTLVQTNTDGIIIKYPLANEQQVVDAVAEWQKASKMSMEWTLVKNVFCQKDVNNFVMQLGETWLYDENGNKVITKQDKNEIHAKGGWVSLWQGGTWKNNSLVILHKALVNYFAYGIKPEDTINQATDIFDFQIICKTTMKFSNTIHIVDNTEYEVQRCNRVYATKDEKYGMIYKIKNGSRNKFPDVPEHCIIDNDNHLTLADIDKQYYIDLAYKRINDYKGIKQEKPKATKRKEKAMAAVKEDFSKLNIMQKLIKARADFVKKGVKKTGVNKHVGYLYFKLDDIVPPVLEIFEKYGLYHEINFIDDTGYMRVFNADNLEETEREFMIPMQHMEANKANNPVQVHGAEITYYTRYLYMNMMQIAEAEIIIDNENELKLAKDAENAEDDSKNVTTDDVKKHIPATKEKRKEAVKEMTSGNMTDAQKKSIVNGLRKLQDSEENHEVYINDISEKIKKWKAGNLEITTEEAEAILLEIGEKVMAKNEAQN